MPKILKYRLITDGSMDYITLPLGSRVFSTIEQRGHICIYAAVPTSTTGKPSTLTQKRRFWILGTGFEVPAECLLEYHIGTIEIGPEVWHIFVEPSGEQEVGVDVQHGN